MYKGINTSWGKVTKIPSSLLSEVNGYFQGRPDDPTLGHIWLIDTENAYESIHIQKISMN